MDTIWGIIFLFVVVGVGMWLWEKSKDLFWCIGEGIAVFLDNPSKALSRKKKAKCPTKLRALPESQDAHNTLESFCRIMHKIDSAMSPYCQYEGQGSLYGGIDANGKGYSHFWYDKDYAGIDSVFEELGYFSPNGHEWSIQNGIINYNSNSVPGYQEWTGYSNQFKEYGSREAAENAMRQQIEAVIHNEWPEATITSYSVHFDAPSGELFCFSVKIKTTIPTF